MRFPFQRKAPTQDDKLRKLLKSLPPGGRTLVVYEGERVSPDYKPFSGDVEFRIVRHWRPEDEPISWPVEPEPGYQRPVNWRQIEAREDKQPGYAEVVNG